MQWKNSEVCCGFSARWRSRSETHGRYRRDSQDRSPPSFLRRWCVFGFTVVVAGCGARHAPATEPELDPKTLVIGVDGLRIDAFEQADAPVFEALIARGRYGHAQTQTDAQLVSAPGWTSILTGVSPKDHLVRVNGEYDDIDRKWATFPWRVRNEGGRTAGAVHWVDLGLILEPDAMDLLEMGDDDAVAEDMAEVLADGEHDLHFVHFDDCDHAGHSTGFSADNPDYIGAVEAIDARAGRLLDAIEARETRADERWLVVVVTDHGGDGTSHGFPFEGTLNIPLVVAADGVSPGALPEEGLTHMDVAPTVLSWMGVPAVEGLAGHVVGLD